MGKKAPLSFLGLRDKTPRTEQEFFEGIRLPSKLVNSFRGFVRKALDSFFQWLDANSRKKSLALASWCATRGRMHKIGG